MSLRPVVVTGQQIGAGWTPALSVAKALAALAEARRTGAEAVYWLADEDHDHAEVAKVVGWSGPRVVRHRFRFEERPGTATGWLAWTKVHQAQAEALWGRLPTPPEPTLRSHVMALGQPLWERGLRPFSPTEPDIRHGIQSELVRWRGLPLESLLIQQADRLAAAGAPLPLDPRHQAAWFSLHPESGRRHRLAAGEPLPQGCWLSPGAALRPLMQSLLLPVSAVVLGPSERAYWRLCEPLWEAVRLAPPRIVDRPSVVVVPSGFRLAADQLETVRTGDWEHLAPWQGALPTQRLGAPAPDPAWPEPVQVRFQRELARSQGRLEKLDRRLHREAVARWLGGDPERLRQALFPLGLPQERVLPGVAWLRQPNLLDAILERMDGQTPLILVEEP